MGQYNSQYEDYYTSLKKKSRGRYTPTYNSDTTFSKSERTKGNYLIKRITRDLIGVFILFMFVIACKLVNIPQTQAVYNYSKNIMEQNYNLQDIKEKSQSIDIRKFQDKATYIIEQIRVRITGKETVGSKIKNNFVLPLEGTETSSFGYRTDPVTKEKKFHEGIDIDAKENTNVAASFDGRIKDCGQDGELGKYIVIDHGEGIETKYGHLNEVLVNREDAVKKSQVIAKSGNTGKSTGPHLHFELLYMGENKNPEEYFNLVKK